jgi:polar amino acid transport system substrate-binding protein
MIARCIKVVWCVVTLSLLCMNARLYAAEGVIVSGHEEYAPFMWRQGDEIVGVGIDVVNIIFHDLGIKVTSRYVGPWKRILRKIELGEVDVLCGGYITDDRLKYMAFTEEPLSADPTAVFVWHSRSFPFESRDDLKGIRFGEVLGESQGQEFDAWRKRYASVEEVPTSILNIKKLEANRIDAFVTGLYSGLLHIKKEGYAGRIIPLEHPVNTEYLHIGISKKSKYIQYLPQINRKLRELHRNGTIDRLIQYHLEHYSATQLGAAPR